MKKPNALCKCILCYVISSMTLLLACSELNSKLKCQNTSKWKTNNINLPKADWPLYKQQCWLCKHGYTHYAYIHEYAHFTNMYILRSTSIVYTQWNDLRRSYTIYNIHVRYIVHCSIHLYCMGSKYFLYIVHYYTVTKTYVYVNI